MGVFDNFASLDGLIQGEQLTNQMLTKLCDELT